MQTIDHKIERLNALRQQIRKWRVGTAIATFAVTGVCLLILQGAAVGLFQKGPAHDEFVAEFKSGLVREVVPQARTITQQTWKELAPKVRTEVVMLELRSPEMAEGVRREVETLQNNLQSRTESVLRDTVVEAVKARQATIQRLYADVTPEKTERIAALLLTEGQRRVGHLTEVVVAPYEQALQKMVADLGRIRETEPVAGNGHPTSDDVAAVLFKLAEEQFDAQSASAKGSVKAAQEFAEAK